MALVPTIPFDAPGAHHGFLRLPYSRDDSAWGSVMIPISVLCGGAGPTVLLTAGNHGDEYEGILALRDLCHRLDPARLAGRVIVLPQMNAPAVAAGTRTSPIDRGNLNRSFPGRPDGTVTERIADYVSRTLLPLADLVADLHSGGRTLDFLPFAASHVLPDKAQENACAAAVAAFGAPWSVKMLEIDAAGMFDTEAEAQGKVFVTTELGGGGTTGPERMAIARRGVWNLLHHAGCLEGPGSDQPTRWLDMPDGDCFVFAEDGGLAEPLVDLGQTVRRGDPVMRLWPLGRPGGGPVPLAAARDGIVVCRHVPGIAQPGDCLCVVAVPLD